MMIVLKFIMYAMYVGGRPVGHLRKREGDARAFDNSDSTGEHRYKSLPL
jgi:hypothetical protein